MSEYLARCKMTCFALQIMTQSQATVKHAWKIHNHILKFSYPKQEFDDYW